MKVRMLLLALWASVIACKKSDGDAEDESHSEVASVETTNVNPEEGTEDLSSQAEEAPPSSSIKAVEPGSSVAVAVSYTSPSNFLPPTAGSYGLGARLVFQFIFNEPITVSGTPMLSVQVGTKQGQAILDSHGEKSLEFIYTTELGDMDSDGLELRGLDYSNGEIHSLEDSLVDPELDGLTSQLAGVLVDTSQAAPSQVTGLTVAPALVESSISVTWTVPSGNGSTIKSYLVQYRRSGSSVWSATSTNHNSFTLESLEAGVSYDIRVAANNDRLGQFSAVASAQTFHILSLNPIAWLDATDPFGDGLPPNHGDLLASWHDKTGKAGAAEEVELDRQPEYQTDVQNGLPAVRFDNKDRGLEGTFTRTEGSDLTIAIVGQFDDGVSDRCLFEFRNGSGNARAFFIDRRYAANTFYDPTLTKGSFKLWLIENKGAQAKVREDETILYDGALYFNTDFIGEGQYVLGDDTTGSNRLVGYIGEILIFDKELSSSELDTLRAYLKSKWGL
ncbi:fibronectin type III domain-containing protein [Pseudobacteriovorax antillogorgiicola]|uniref:Fibronectin type III domain-containing protein n=1 Tax=Pseudobacteriovorax antillogorgiicola TaxID=1513793 RepID=A0A1Y6C3E0_9BACT|nr:fibronectin type III domain-containing protein [Pseudobacteriovorax antillogorgiicola]TCS49826.1 fibronectin type III domain protein [Pseudobacteriovorax antillogorgiicola]SMF43333.1 Fibronectin type III domain-containing protein [Pseudobacteriovorax antillogorgiicola]